jgi:catechol 2,3-dioxygenase-like lactoylglutathione lyase family enzyme
MELSGLSHVALTVRDINVSREFYSKTLGLTLVDSNDSYCALLVGAPGLSALILTSHPECSDERFSEFRTGLDHVSLAVPTVQALKDWQARLDEQSIPSDLRRSEWGHHLNFRDPDNIAVEFVVVQPDAEVQAILDDAGVA